jgi:hypothetical protein
VSSFSHASMKLRRVAHERIVESSWVFVNCACGLLLAAGIVVTGCGDSKTTRHLTSLSVTPDDVEAVAPTGTAQFSVTGTFDQAPVTDTGVAVQWTTSDSSVATVTASGVATCLAAGGPITVTATGQGATGTVSASATLTCLSSNPSVGIGKCVTTETNSLTGYCEGPRGGICREAYDPTNCPPQTSVTNPQVNQCAQSSFTVDPMRSCTP